MSIVTTTAKSTSAVAMLSLVLLMFTFFSGRLLSVVRKSNIENVANGQSDIHHPGAPTVCIAKSVPLILFLLQISR
jgi:hypothetical protein